MASSFAFSLLLFLCLLPLSSIIVSAKKTYIVAMNHQDKPECHPTHQDWHIAILESLSSTSDSHLYSYTDAFHGFAADLDEAQVESLRESESVLGVFEDQVNTPTTTRTPHFLGLDSGGLWEGHTSQQLEQASANIIIGVLDSGIWLESKSFDDTGMPPVPKKWRGVCESGPDFSSNLCNKKFIGARYFGNGVKTKIRSPRDDDDVGHGTHVASIAAGSRVANASLHGYTLGTARGMATHARLAIYKVCWDNGVCLDSDILAAIDTTIRDGVDILSMSIRGGDQIFYYDIKTIGAFAAMEKGILFVGGAGNNGPNKSTVGHVAPLSMSVGAGTIDRNFIATVSLGNKQRLPCVSLYSGKGLDNKYVPLVYDSRTSNSKKCMVGSLSPTLVRGKVVLCDIGTNTNAQKAQVVHDAGGVGIILASTANNSEGPSSVVTDLIPNMAVGVEVGDSIRKYALTFPNATARLNIGGTVFNERPAPRVAAFSSRGPSLVSPHILKPDVIGPGVDILAAVRDGFQVETGTSMATPHISGVAALIKAAHPDWSPCAIKSALMTTAYVIDNTNSTLQDAWTDAAANPWAFGAGYINPPKAFSPGLVYDINPEQYIAFLCSLGYTSQQIGLVTRRPNPTCSTKFTDPGELNYPTFSISFATKKVVQYNRTLTSVDSTPLTYNMRISGPPSVKITVSPAQLTFGKLGEKKSYKVTFELNNGATSSVVDGQFGSIVWANAKHQVRSTVMFYSVETFGGIELLTSNSSRLSMV